MNHTPGPWASKLTSKTHNQYAVYKEDGDGRDIATVRTGKLDAQLIAAAPDLLYALDCISAEIDRHVRNGTLGSSTWTGLVVMARDAMRKAQSGTY